MRQQIEFSRVKEEIVWKVKFCWCNNFNNPTKTGPRAGSNNSKSKPTVSALDFTDTTLSWLSFNYSEPPAQSGHYRGDPPNPLWPFSLASLFSDHVKSKASITVHVLKISKFVSSVHVAFTTHPHPYTLLLVPHLSWMFPSYQKSVTASPQQTQSSSCITHVRINTIIFQPLRVEISHMQSFTKFYYFTS